MSERRDEVRIVEAVVHGRYLLDVPPAGGAQRGLVGFHGYGEDAVALLEELRRLPGEDEWLLVSVQALHRFYRGRSQDVVASWMTRQDREAAIRDNIRYVRSVVDAVRREFEVSQVVFAGFSQGVAMAFRAAADALASGRGCDGLIVLGGDVPPELAADPGLRLPPVLIGRGREDTWYTAEKLEADRAALRARGVAVETQLHPGGHEWTPEFREAAGEFLWRLARRAVT